MKPWYWTNDVDAPDEERGWCIVEEGTERTVALDLTQDDAIYIVRLHNEGIGAREAHATPS